MNGCDQSCLDGWGCECPEQPKPRWGEDPSKWVIKKSEFGRGWCVFPPNDGEMWIHPSFDAVVSCRSCGLHAARLAVPRLGDGCGVADLHELPEGTQPTWKAGAMTPEERIAKTIRDDWTGCGQDWSPVNGMDYATHVAAVVVEELYDHGYEIREIP